LVRLILEGAILHETAQLHSHSSAARQQCGRSRRAQQPVEMQVIGHLSGLAAAERPNLAEAFRQSTPHQ
jgi:hypothetical protein